jgi:hypothetical protein
MVLFYGLGLPAGATSRQEDESVVHETREKLMESLPKPGEIFDGTRLDDFFKVNRAILPSDASKDDVNIKRDLKTRTVAILFDFRTCSPTAL